MNFVWILTVDPGLRGCGYAWWSADRLAEAGYAEGEKNSLEAGPEAWLTVARAVLATRPTAAPIALFAVETMRIYTRSKSDPADILQLQGVAGTLTGMCGAERVVGLEPSVWKGQVPRDVMGARQEKWLTDTGQWDKIRRPKRKTQLNDVMHAVGIGRFIGSLSGRSLLARKGL